MADVPVGAREQRLQRLREVYASLTEGFDSPGPTEARGMLAAA
jgi:hypothetical protein